MTARTTMTPETCDTVPTGVLSVEQARERILAPLRPVSGTERLNLRQALGRILAVEVRAGFAVPSYRNASMDGYAFTHADLAHSRSLQQVGISWAGQPYAGVLKTGECVRIMTGAMVPAQADTVQMQENVSIEEMRITLTAIPEPGANIRHPGEDMQAGDR
ncbi:MAG TPA: molybdopterin molybdenumtransferase MoeA, partial [Thiolinea sp.]|nr:molybdopterin molybdenumtransferase MoeA [Thiolinea sp.]